VYSRSALTRSTISCARDVRVGVSVVVMVIHSFLLSLQDHAVDIDAEFVSIEREVKVIGQPHATMFSNLGSCDILGQWVHISSYTKGERTNARIAGWY
jgi:hypothetical protein